MLSGKRIRNLAISSGNIDSDNSSLDIHLRRGLYCQFFYKPKIELIVLNVKRQTHNHLSGQWKEAIVLEARVINKGRAIAKNARIHLKIKDVTCLSQILSLLGVVHPEIKLCKFAHQFQQTYKKWLTYSSILHPL